MSKVGITDFDIGVGFRTPSYYRTASEWILSLYGAEQYRQTARNRKRGHPWTLMAGATILGVYIQIDLRSIRRS